jgi:hypothetical protein
MGALKRILGLVAIASLMLTISSPTAVAAKRTGPTTPSKPIQPNAAERQDFHEKMLAIPHGEGCFVARYGDPQPRWQKIKCGKPPKTPNPMAKGPKPNYVGNGQDYFSQPGGIITSATGSFDSVTNVTALSGPTYNSPTVAHTNVYSLQMNANTFTTAACSGSPNCLGWEQFLYSQTQCNGACIFIEYWLLYHTSPCPAGQGWIYYAGTPTTASGCYLNTAFAGVPVQALNDLGSLRLSGSISGNIDTVSLSVANGNVYSATNSSIAGLGQGWKTVEYNLVGDCCAFGTYFTVGPASIKVRLSTTNGTQNAPTCVTSATGATAETNNLNLTGACSATGGAKPAITFTESGGGPLPPGISQGDTHLVTISGDHYDFQGTGEYVLVQTPDLTIQARQDYLGANRSVSWNVALAVQMGNNRVIIYPNMSMVINLAAPNTLADGGSVTLDGGVTINRHGNLLTMSRAEGDIVQANSLGDHIDVTVRLQPFTAAQAHGLMISRNNSLLHRDGTALKGEVSTTVFDGYIDSWRVDPAQSLLPADGRPTSNGKSTLSRADAPSKAAQDQARAACSRVGVKNDFLLKDCVLDVAVTGNEALADTYVFAPKPKRGISLKK